MAHGPRVVEHGPDKCTVRKVFPSERQCQQSDELCKELESDITYRFRDHVILKLSSELLN